MFRERLIYTESLQGLVVKGRGGKKTDGTNNLFNTLRSRILKQLPKGYLHGFQRLATPTTEMLVLDAYSHLY